MIAKTIQKTEGEYFIQFTDEELAKLNLKKGSKFDWKIQEDGSVMLIPWQSIDLDIEDWDKDLLLFLIKESLEKDLPINDIIVDLLQKKIDDFSNDIDDNPV
jgi:hypothetical protein